MDNEKMQKLFEGLQTSFEVLTNSIPVMVKCLNKQTILLKILDMQNQLAATKNPMSGNAATGEALEREIQSLRRELQRLEE